MHPYQSILQLPHHVSPRRRGMSRRDRAAQFAPFAALTGHGAAIRETARLTEVRAELDEDQKLAINRTLQLLLADVSSQPEVSITYFLPDSKKDGGSYAVVSGCVQKIDVFAHQLILTNGVSIPIEQIYDLQREASWIADDWSK